MKTLHDRLREAHQENAELRRQLLVVRERLRALAGAATDALADVRSPLRKDNLLQQAELAWEILR